MVNGIFYMVGYHLVIGNSDRVHKLVESMDVNKQNNVGDTALIRASESGT